MDHLKKILPGIILTLSVALIAMAAGYLSSLPYMFIALIAGICFSFRLSYDPLGVGIDWSAKYPLQIGVVLLGFSISLEDIAILGWSTVVFLALSITLIICLGFLLGRIKKFSLNTSILTAVGTAICGTSAIMAIAGIASRHKIREEDVALSVIAVTAVSSLAMLVYPYIISSLNVDGHVAGIFLGASIHNVPQAVGAGYILSPLAGEAATLTKMIRVCFLIPVALVFMIVFHSRTFKDNQVSKTPLFLIAFFAFIILTNLFDFSDGFIDLTNDIAKFLLLISIAAIGLKSEPRKIFNGSATAFTLVFLHTFVLAAMSLCFVLFLK